MRALPILLTFIVLPTVALAEGTDQVNTTQALRAGTQLYLDILEPGTESIRWIGVGDLTVRDPAGVFVATLASGETADTTGLDAGAYSLINAQGQVVGIRWDVEVVGQTDSGGRLHSDQWRFDAGAFSADRSTYASVYAIVPGGAAGQSSVIELQLDGLAGYVYDLSANRIGVDGPDGGRSVPMRGHTVTPEFPIYLQPPTVATYASVTPQAYGLEYIGGVSTDVEGNAIDPCAEVVPGESFGRFQFDTNVEGTYHLECDLDDDGLFEATNGDDFLAVGTTTPGLNTVLWDGTHEGAPVSFGTYQCRVRINVGEFHYVGADIETSYQGLRMYAVGADLDRTPLPMRWNDTAVQAQAAAMPNGEVGLGSSGEGGMDPGPYGATAIANQNARSWGNHTASGKGNQSYLDTYVWLASETSATIAVTAVDGTLDGDDDGLGDFAERCFYGSDPSAADTDGDGTPDGEQYGDGASSGTVGGLESNGRLGSQLARRAIARSRFSAPAGLAARVGATEAALTDPALGPIAAIFETLAVTGLERVDATPNDLPALTNAEDVYAFDLVEGGRVEGSVLVVETIGETYEHSKALCDRAGGATLVGVGAIGALDALLATYRQREEGTLDQAVELKLYATGDGRWVPESRWLRDQYPPVETDQRVLNVQVWGKRCGLASQLVSQLLDALADAELLHSAASTPLDETTVDRWNAPERERTSPPTVTVKEATLLGSTLAMKVDRFAGGPNAVTLHLDRVASDGTPLAPLRFELGSIAGETDIELDVGLVRDLTVDVLDEGKLEDRLWLSDGAWAPYDDAIWGGATEATFTDDCIRRTSEEEGSLRLAGCARAGATRVDRFAGVARHIPRGVALADFGRARFWYRSDGRAELCAEDTSTGERHCRSLPSAPSGRWAEVDLTPLRSNGARVRLVSLTQSRAGTLEVSALSFAPGVPTSDSGGCATAGRPDPTSAGPLALVLLLLWRPRRFRALRGEKRRSGRSRM